MQDAGIDSTPPGVRVHYMDQSGARISSEVAQFVALDHLEGGYILWPDAPKLASDVDVEGLPQVLSTAHHQNFATHRMRVHRARK